MPASGQPDADGDGPGEPGEPAVVDRAGGVAAALRLITDPALAGTTGEFYDGTERSRARAEAYDQEFRRRLRRNTDALLASALEGRSGAE